MEKKVCSKCNLEKDVNDFSMRKNRKSKYCSQCKKCRCESGKRYREANIEKVKESKTKYYKNNSEKVSAYARKYYNDNNEKIRKEKRNYSKNRRDNDTLYNLKIISRSRLQKIFKIKDIKKSNKTFNIIGCTPLELKTHLEKQFIDGMTWENYGFYGWHIDHKIPLNSGTNENEILKLCHFTNLQPLWWRDNLSKGYKIF
jgi:hypothetical protein